MSELNTMQLTNVQMELLKLFQMEISTEELKEIKSMISKYLADKGTNDFDNIISQKGISSKEVSNWQYEHNRANY